MTVPVNEKVKVVTIYDPIRKKSGPLYIHWRHRMYKVEKLGFHHKKRVGREMVHIFEVVSDTAFFRLRFETESLDWILEGVSDGLGN